MNSESLFALCNNECEWGGKNNMCFEKGKAAVTSLECQANKKNLTMSKSKTQLYALRKKSNVSELGEVEVSLGPLK